MAGKKSKPGVKKADKKFSAEEIAEAYLFRFKDTPTPASVREANTSDAYAFKFNR